MKRKKVNWYQKQKDDPELFKSYLQRKASYYTRKLKGMQEMTDEAQAMISNARSNVTQKPQDLTLENVTTATKELLEKHFILVDFLTTVKPRLEEIEKLREENDQLQTEYLQMSIENDQLKEENEQLQQELNKLKEITATFKTKLREILSNEMEAKQ